MEFKYNTTFANLHIKPVVSEDKDKYLSLASIANLKKFLPDIDTNKNIDLLPIAFDACVVNRVNKNGDVINSTTAAEMVNNFINKPINIEHDRSRVVGCILTASFSKFGSNESLAELDVKTMKEPFYITLGGVMWKIINPQLANLIEESNDPSSENYMKVSASWELGFSEYDLVLLDNNNKNLEDAKFVTDEDEKDKLSKNLKAFGGTGKINNNTYIYRQVVGDVIPLGIGLTSNPAADVQGVAVKDEDKIAVIEFKSKEGKSESSNNSENNISQNTENTVNQEGVINRIIMKIENINQITDELLKQVTASSVTDFIQEELKKASEAFVAEKNEKDSAIKAAQEKYETLSTESEKVKEELEKLKATLAKLEEEKIAKAKEEAFNLRMASFDEEFDLSDEDRQILATDIKDLDEEAFAAYKKKMTVLMKDKNKAAKKVMMEEEMKKAKASEVKEEVKASTSSEQSATEVVDEVLDNANVEKTSIPNSTTTAEVSLREKYSKAFGFEGFDIN
ncbi:MAG: hypothetical protein EBR82_17600 [Caulobacteraceae bacterium]|nr:hypothetical protein [Caulobacteraceae bacterium]